LYETNLVVHFQIGDWTGGLPALVGACEAMAEGLVGLSAHLGGGLVVVVEIAQYRTMKDRVSRSTWDKVVTSLSEAVTALMVPALRDSGLETRDVGPQNSVPMRSDYGAEVIKSLLMDRVVVTVSAANEFGLVEPGLAAGAIAHGIDAPLLIHCPGAAVRISIDGGPTMAALTRASQEVGLSLSAAVSAREAGVPVLITDLLTVDPSAIKSALDGCRALSIL